MKKNLLARVLKKINKTNDCWIWTGAISGNGYGQIWGDKNGKQMSLPAHRVVYGLLVGEIPDKLDIDHLCRNKTCVNPAHLEPISHQENIIRGYMHKFTEKGYYGLDT